MDYYAILGINRDANLHSVQKACVAFPGRPLHPAAAAAAAAQAAFEPGCSGRRWPDARSRATGTGRPAPAPWPAWRTEDRAILRACRMRDRQ